MGSIIKMFKPSKKHNNKENVPFKAVSFATGSLKSKKSSLNESVYAGEPQKIDLRLKSPYAVVTAPKTTRGPMSCPGAPLDDRSFRSSSRKVKDDSVLNTRSELVDQQSYRNMMARKEYDMSMSRLDDSDEEKEELKAKYRAKKQEVNMLKGKLEKMRVKWREDKSMMTETIDDLSNENYQLRKSHDRLRHKYSELKANMDIEKKVKCDVLKKLQEANERIEKLEKFQNPDESLNNSSLLIPSYSVTDGTMEMSSEGAGEALCFPDDNNMRTSLQSLQALHQTSHPLTSFGMIFSSSSTNANSRTDPLPKSLEDDLEAQDEVRVYRDSIESIDQDEEMTEEEADDRELSSPFELETTRDDDVDKERKRVTIPRAHSDSDLMKGIDTISLTLDAPAARPAPPVQEHRQKYSRTSSWLKRNSVNPEDDGSSDSSEEERLSLIDRQLKKKGGLVKYQPPRTKIHDRHYKRFGKNERSALAEFEYLQDMSTDVSGLQSSPELGQLMGQFAQNKIKM